MLKITTDPRASGSGIGARRKNGDQVFLRGENIKQLRTVRKVLIKMAQHFQLPMAELGDFLGVDRINLTNRDLLECLSTVPNLYSEVDFAVAIEAWRRDYKITTARRSAGAKGSEPATAGEDERRRWPTTLSNQSAERSRGREWMRGRDNSSHSRRIRVLARRLRCTRTSRANSINRQDANYRRRGSEWPVSNYECTAGALANGISPKAQSSTQTAPMILASW
jgi:hypothetical protein